MCAIDERPNIKWAAPNVQCHNCALWLFEYANQMTANQMKEKDEVEEMVLLERMWSTQVHFRCKRAENVKCRWLVENSVWWPIHLTSAFFPFFLLVSFLQVMPQLPFPVRMLSFCITALDQKKKNKMGKKRWNELTHLAALRDTAKISVFKQVTNISNTIRKQ